MNMFAKTAVAAAAFALCSGAALAQSSSQVGVLSCDVSGGIGLILVQKQTMNCTFSQNNGMVERYVGQIAEYGVALGGVQAGHLVWGVAGRDAGTSRRRARGHVCGRRRAGDGRRGHWRQRARRRHGPRVLAAASLD